MASTMVVVDQTLLRMGFTQDGNRLARRVGTGQVIVDMLEGGRRIRVIAKHDTEGLMLNRSFDRKARWGAIEDALNAALALLVK